MILILLYNLFSRWLVLTGDVYCVVRVCVSNRSIFPVDGPPFSHDCPRCGRRYSHKCSMIRHLKRECGVEPAFSCTVCDYRTNRRGNLNAHMHRHMCGKYFAADRCEDTSINVASFTMLEVERWIIFIYKILFFYYLPN